METKKLITVNSLSGGKSSSYIAANYKADYNIFALVRTTDKNCIYPDKKIRQIVSDKIDDEFIGTLEQDNIINIMLDLEQYIGQEITWIKSPTFDDILIKELKGRHLPNVMHRECTHHMKFKPILNWWNNNFDEPIDMRIGFRYGEERRKARIDERLIDGFQYDKVIVGKSSNGRNKWQTKKWRKLSYPLIDNIIKSIDIEKYWKNNKNVRFQKGYYNNCVGCFHRNPMFLNKMAQEHKNKMEWFAKQENDSKYWKSKKELYKDIMNYKPQIELSFDDFNECDSGYCGL